MHATGSWTTCPAATNLQPEEFFYRLWREATRRNSTVSAITTTGRVLRGGGVGQGVREARIAMTSAESFSAVLTAKNSSRSLPMAARPW